jgi:MFS family permease
MGSYLGFALGAGLVSVLQLTLGQAGMEAWGWRIPFLIAGPLGIIAIYFRMKIEESPAFQATLDAEAQIARHPETGEVLGPMGPVGIFKAYWQRIVLAMILVAAANTVGYALTSYMPTYLTTNKGYDEIHGTLLTIPVLVVMSLCIPLTGHLSDRIGRRPVLWIGAISTVVLSLPAFILISIGSVPATITGLALVAFPRHVLRCQPRLGPAGLVSHRPPLRGHGHRLQLRRGHFRRHHPVHHCEPDPADRQRHDARVLPHGHLGDRCGHHLLPAGIRPEASAGVHAQRGFGGGCPRTGGNPGR